MAAQFPVLSDKLMRFIESQQLFFVATAAEGGRINLSPKGADTLRVLSESRLLWVNFTGSGNETAAHLRQTDRMTMMFCSFTEQPMILRCYGKARAFHPRDPQWRELAAQVPEHPSSRQLVQLDIELVQTSCGFGVPFYEYGGERENMEKWLAAKSPADIEAYWQEKNQLSIDGMPTGIFQDDA